MPINLVTGLPGHGKTLYTLARWKVEAEKDGRPVFHNGIKGLNLAGWQVWDVEKWQDLPANSLFVIDEAQFAFPVTGRGQTPEWVQKLATHRHLGIDIVVITQNPMLLDTFVRKLVDRHFHVVRKFGTHFATIYEFPNGVRENVATKRSDGIKHEWRYPKDVFGWYQSAEVHTVKRRVPMRVWLLFALPFIIGALVWVVWKRLDPHGDRMQRMAGKEPAAAGVTVAPGGQGGNGPGKPTAMTVEEYAAVYRARIPGLSHTAPIYDEVTKPTEAPYPAACVSMKGQCRCYSQQATRLAVVAELCEQIVAGGYFVGWNRPVAQAVPIAPSGPPPVAGLGSQVVVAAAGPSYGFSAGAPVPFEAHRQTAEAAAQQIPPDLGAPPRVRSPR